ncbi:MAG: hypothetical protein AAFX85_16805, partial [Pseudomonadota bacterium]
GIANGMAVAQIPDGTNGNSGVLFAAWDDNRSYTFYLGINFQDVRPGQFSSYSLPDFEGYFPDPAAVRWNVVAVDGEGDVFAGGAGVFMTGAVSNLTSGAGVIALVRAVDVYIDDVNQVCPTSDVCLAEAGDLNYAGRDSYGSNFGFSGGLSNAKSLLEANAFITIIQVPFDPDGQADVRPRPFFWAVQGDTLVYGTDYCIEWDDFDDSISVVIDDRRQRTGTWINFDNEGGTAPLVGADTGNISTLFCASPECPGGPNGRAGWRFDVDDNASRATLSLVTPRGDRVIRDDDRVAFRPGACPEQRVHDLY